MRGPAPVYGVALPVLTGVRFSADDYRIRPDLIFGTAVPIGDRHVLTAAHVVANAEVGGAQLLLAYPARQPDRDLQVGEAEVEARWSDVDVAVLRCPDVDIRPLA